ncbi:hypothetical protein [Mechercharimyces sp. CAU 1602]|uniref:hypothetical protein n=1 Tax=Mechercharimyces sp. CAU 1602 TaxID=2973933 RepID=UPI002162EDE2|nr:hypothetical protein [Mechercharimyces sp. CAU 1602]MCS1351997.1 hypothetical protein [Mechercharimyces sp. CAU 1602]
MMIKKKKRRNSLEDPVLVDRLSLWAGGLCYDRLGYGFDQGDQELVVTTLGMFRSSFIF